MKTTRPEAKWYFSVLIATYFHENHPTIIRYCIYYKRPVGVLAKTGIFFDLVIYKRAWLILLYIVTYIIISITVFPIVTVTVIITTIIVCTIPISNQISPGLLVDIEADIRLYLLYLVVARVENNSF